ncbi:MAG: CHAT domain-containing protein [Ktedonobacteraceae bacterium]
MAVVECLCCGLKALKLAQRTQCPACSTPYQFHETASTPAGEQASTTSTEAEEANTKQWDNEPAEDWAPALKAQILGIMENIFRAKHWDVVLVALEEQQEILLLPETWAFLRAFSELAREEEADGLAEHIDMYVHLFEDARAHSIESAWQSFIAEQQHIVDAMQKFGIAIVQGDIRSILEEKRDLLLSATTFAALYRGIDYFGADTTDTGKVLILYLRLLWDAREGKLPTSEQLQEMLQEVSQTQSPGKITMLPGIPGIDPDDPQIADYLQEMTGIMQEKPDLMSSYSVEMMRWLEPDPSGRNAPHVVEEGIPHLRETVTEILTHLSREKQPHMWASFYTIMESFDMYESERQLSPSPSFMNDDPPFTFEEAPVEWANAMALRAMAPYLRSQEGEGRDEDAQAKEQAIAKFTRAISVFTYESNPLEWTIYLSLRSLAYKDRREGEPRKNIELALGDLDTVLASLQRDEYPIYWAQATLLRCIIWIQIFHFTNERDQLERVITDTTQVLSIFTREDDPEEWADALVVRGLAFVERKKGEKEQNIMRALADFELAETVMTREKQPEEWAKLQMNIGSASIYLFRDDRSQNIERAIVCLDNALLELTPEKVPVSWARTHLNRGMAYMERSEGDHQQNQEKALQDFTDALSVLSKERNPIDWGRASMARSNFYLLRIADDKRSNYEQAIADCNNALHIFTREHEPILWAVNLTTRGTGYRGLSMPSYFTLEHNMVSFGEMLKRGMVNPGLLLTNNQYLRYINDYNHFTQLALADFDEALSVLTPENNPQEWAYICRERATTHAHNIFGSSTEKHRANADYEAALTVFTRQSMPGQWATTLSHRAAYYQSLVQNGQTQYAEQLLADLNAAGTVFKRELDPSRYRNLQFGRAQLFTTLQLWQEAHEAFVEVRAAQRTLVINSIDNRNQIELIADFSFADIYLRDAQVLLHLQQPEEAVMVLEEGRAQILRGTLALDTIIPESINSAAARQRATDLLMKLADWRQLQHKAISSLQQASATPLEGTDNLEEAYESLFKAVDAIRQYDNPDFLAPHLTLKKIGSVLAASDEALVYLTTGLLDGEKHGMALIVTRNEVGDPRVQPILLPYFTRQAITDLFIVDDHTSSVSDKDAGSPLINIERAIHVLGSLAFNDVVKALLKSEIHKVRLITYGRLGLFPLPSIYVTLPNKRKQPLGEMFDEVTLVPSARSLEILHERLQLQRDHILIAGDPQPLSNSPREWPRLRYAASEAEACYHIATMFNYPSTTLHYLLPREMTKQRVIEELQRARYAHLALHGVYETQNPQHSRLILAGEENIPEAQRTLSLYEALAGFVNLTGLRLLVLSACETSVFDIRRAPDEVMGLATGFLQAGATGVIASLWKVDDCATYLLMSRFTELYLNSHTQMSPAQALAMAQHWLREEATNRLLQTYQPDLAAQTLEGLSKTHKRWLSNLHVNATLAASKEPDACLYADPIHWAAFVVTGC